MSRRPHPTEAPGARSTFSWRLSSFSNLLLLSFLAWATVSLVMTIAVYNDTVRQGGSAQFGSLYGVSALYFAPWIAFSVVVSRVLEYSFSGRLAEPWVFFRILGVTTLCFYVPYVAYEVVVQMLMGNIPMARFPARFVRFPAMSLLGDYLLFLFAFVTHYGIAFVTESLARERHKQRVESENMALRLALEQQRLVSLQAQLEPHFLFNALNAISALVRSGDRQGALSALQILSELLRYALMASQREWVTVGEELAFVRDYIFMQMLRHGERLKFTVAGDTPELMEADCPPLLLQPLVENAIRHDLECHEGDSDIQLSFQTLGSTLLVKLSNPTHAVTTANPGMGLGLQSVMGRIKGHYGERATFQTIVDSGLFTIELRLPLRAHD